MLKRNCLPVGAAVGFVVSLFASTLSDSAYAASGCLASPNRESGPGTHWNYRINQTTKERCWYLKKVGEKSRSRPTNVAHAKRSRVTHDVAATSSRPAPVEVAAPAENEAPPPRKRRAATAERSESKTARAQQLTETAKEATEDTAVATPSDQQ